MKKLVNDPEVFAKANMVMGLVVAGLYYTGNKLIASGIGVIWGAFAVIVGIRGLYREIRGDH